MVSLVWMSSEASQSGPVIYKRATEGGGGGGGQNMVLFVIMEMVTTGVNSGCDAG